MRVLMVGPDQRAKGGIASVIAMYEQAGLFADDIRFMASTGDGSLLGRMMRFVVFLVRYVQVLMRPELELVHVHLAVRGSLLRKSCVMELARCFGKKVILHFHGAQFLVFYEQSPFYLKALIRRMFAAADWVLALNQTCREHMVDATGARVRVLYNPAVLRYPVRQQAGGGMVNFLFMGRLGARKGVFDIIEAARLLHASNVAIYLYGDGDINEVRRRIAMADVGNKVFLQGWIHGADKHRAFEQAQVLLLPSYNEGMPMAVLEAMAYGMPVIATPVGGVPDAVQHGYTGYLVHPGDVVSLARKMDLLAASESRRVAMGQAGFDKAAREFEVSRILRALRALYQDMQSQPTTLSV